MSDLSDAFFSRARESLAGAENEFDNGRYNNATNRAYYACYQAAIAALDLAGVRPPGSKKEEWGHGFVQAQFAGRVINQRKLYPTVLRDTLSVLFALPQEADYKMDGVAQTRATRVLARARVFVDAVVVQAPGGPVE